MTKLYSHDLLADLLVDKLDQIYIPKHKVVFGPDGAYTDVTLSTPLPVVDATSSGILEDIYDAVTGVDASIQILNQDNTAQNLAIYNAVTGVDSSIQTFNSDNTAQNLNIYNAVTGVDSSVQIFNADNTSENIAIYNAVTGVDASVQAFNADNTAENIAIYNAVTGVDASIVSFNADNTAENTAILNELSIFHSDSNTLGSAATGYLNTIATQTTAINGKIANNFGAVSGGIRTAAQLGDGAGNALTSELVDSINNYRALHVLTPDRTISTSALGSLNAAVTIALAGEGSSGFQLSSGTLAATLTPEQSIDGGTSWVQAQFFDPTTLTIATNLVVTNPNALTIYGLVSIQGASHVRVRVSAYTSGTADGYLRAVRAAGFQAQIPQDLSEIVANKIFCFAIDTLNMASAGTANPLILMRNLSSSTKTVYLKSIAAGTTITNVGANYNVYANPTVTSNGTAQTAVSRTIGSGLTAQLVVTTLPTISVLGSLISAFSSGQNSNTLQVIDTNQVKVPANNSILLTGNPTSNNRNTVATIVWSEL